MKDTLYINVYDEFYVCSSDKVTIAYTKPEEVKYLSFEYVKNITSFIVTVLLAPRPPTTARTYKKQFIETVVA